MFGHNGKTEVVIFQPIFSCFGGTESIALSPTGSDENGDMMMMVQWTFLSISTSSLLFKELSTLSNIDFISLLSSLYAVECTTSTFFQRERENHIHVHLRFPIQQIQALIAHTSLVESQGKCKLLLTDSFFIPCIHHYNAIYIDISSGNFPF